MTDTDRPLCDCPEPCGCYVEGYAAGKDKAYFETLASMDGPPHAEGCACQPCQVDRLHPEGDDFHGKEIPGALRAGRDLGPGGP